MRLRQAVLRSISRLSLGCVRSATIGLRRQMALLAVLAVLSVLAGCSANAGARGAPTARPLPQIHLDWQPMNMPPQASTLTYALGFAPSDSDVVYACTLDPRASRQQLHLWITRDRSAHWTHLADLTVHAGSRECVLTVDVLQPTIAVVNVNWSMGSLVKAFESANYATIDSGASWRQLSSPHPITVGQLATRAGVTYAMVGVDTPSGEQDVLATTSDQFRTWQALPQTQSFGLSGLRSESSSFQGVGFVSPAFWLDPSTESILVAGNVGAGLWRSDDGGAHWTALSAPVNLTLPGTQLVVQAPRSGQSWHICIATSVANFSLRPSNSLTCSADAGHNWQQHPGPNIAFTNPGLGTYYAPVEVFAIDGNGAILAMIYPLGQEAIYRLDGQAYQWQAIGNTPEGVALSPRLSPSSSGDVLWTLSPDQGWFFASYR